MTFLLDTNVWLFAANAPEVLPEDIQAILNKRDAQFALSAISLWEVGKKHQIGKLELNQELGSWLKGALAAHLQVLPITPEVVADAMSLPGFPTAARRMNSSSPLRASTAGRSSPPTRSSRATGTRASTTSHRLWGRERNARSRTTLPLSAKAKAGLLTSVLQIPAKHQKWLPHTLTAMHRTRHPCLCALVEYVQARRSIDTLIRGRPFRRSRGVQRKRRAACNA